MCMCAEYAIGNFRENHHHKDLEEAPEQENDYDQSGEHSVSSRKCNAKN